MMSWIWSLLIGISIAASIILGQGSQLAAAAVQGAQAGITLAVSLAGSLCLWSGVGKLMERAGFITVLSRLLRPALHSLFPSSRKDNLLAGDLSANICANFLGLGNAATPMGIRAAQRLAGKTQNDIANNELCRLVVLNTASIQLIPATVSALRASLGCETPFDILPAVWMSSILSAAAGLCAAFCLGKLWHDA